MASTIRCINPTKLQLLSAFNSLGHLATQTYYNPSLFKTNAPPTVVYDILKYFKWQEVAGKEEAKYSGNVKEGSVGRLILQKPIKHEPSFNHELQNLRNSLNKLKRKYLPNPEPNWGPKARATGGKPEDK